MDATLRSPLLWKAYVLAATLVVIAVAVGGVEGAMTGLALSLVLVYWLVRTLASELRGMADATKVILQGRRAVEKSSGEQSPSGSLTRVLSPLSRDVARGLRRIAEERGSIEVVLGAIVDAVLVLDQANQITLSNSAARELLGLPTKPSKRRLPLLPNNDELLQAVQNALERGESCVSEVPHSGKILRIIATPLETGGGVVLVMHDVTEMRRLESMRRDFVANVSHELKTPLTSIRAYVETLMDGGIDDVENNMRFLRKIDKHAHRLNVLLSDLLSLSRIESGRAIDERKRVNVLDPLHDSFNRLSSIAEDKKINLEINAPVQRLEVLGETEALQQIFDNLITNAITYTEKGGKITVDATRTEKHAEVSVRDSGIGIPDEDLPRIFERFYRVDKARSREQGGTGLGLSIVKHYVQALDGDISVESKPGEGSAFTVSIPAVEGAAEATVK